MFPVKWLNHLLFFENLSGIYRNYCSQKIIKKFFIVFHIFVLMILHTIIIIREQFWLFGEFSVFDANFIYCYFSASAYIIYSLYVVTGICNSGAFMSYYRSASRVAEYLKNDKKLLNALKKIHRFSLTFIVLMLAFATTRLVDVISILANTDSLYFMSVIISQVIFRITVVFQYLMLSVIILIVVYLFKCLTTLISDIQKRLGSYDMGSDEQYDVTEKQIQEWIALYRDLANCCEKVTLCFGRQYFFTLVMSISNYVLLMYQIIYTDVLDKASEIKDNVKLFIMILSYIFVMLMPLVAGQRARNQGVYFHRVLVRLYNTMIIDSSEAKSKLMKDFIRLIKRTKIEIKLFSKISAGMYMVPAILMLSVNYVIVMLQFNHVI